MFDSIEDRAWRTGHGNERTFTEVSESICDKIVVGTDSHRQGGRRYAFATVICLDPDENGRRYFWTRNVVPKKEIPNLGMRLIAETQQSIDIASEILNRNSRLTYDDIVIHVDCSPKDSSHRSGQYADTLYHMVRAYGFPCVIKPDNPWAATGVADRHAR